MQAAAETFFRKGYDATTTQDIAEAVGMLKGSLYYYISAKEDLLYEIVKNVHEVIQVNVDRLERFDAPPLTRTWAFVRDIVVTNAEHLIPAAVFFRDFRSLTGRRRTNIVKLRDAHDQALRDLIHEGQDLGHVHARLDANLAATGILTMCNSLYLWYKPGGRLSANEVAEQYADLAVGALSVDAELLATARAEALARPD